MQIYKLRIDEIHAEVVQNLVGVRILGCAHSNRTLADYRTHPGGSLSPSQPKVCESIEQH
jgi:hypothetical protein